MSADRNKIVNFCEEYLKVKDFNDYCVNGLQVEGDIKINKIVVGVSLCEQLIKAAIKKKAEMIIVHHGIFTNHISQPPKIGNYLGKRLKLLLANNINLCGFHLPLDAHPVIGNNISLCNLFGLSNIKPFDVGFLGEFKKEILFSDFVKTIDKKLDTKSYTISAGPKKIKKIGIISGGVSYDFLPAHELGADTFLCGEIKESTVRSVEEVGINFINAGHYNTEKLGIKNLGALVAKKFKIKVEFIDIPNGI